MAFGQLLLITSILLLIVVQDILPAEEDFRNIQPIHYTIVLKPYTIDKLWNDDIFCGEYNASFRIYNATQTIILQSEDVLVYKAEVLTRHRFTDHVYTFTHTPILEQYSHINKTFTLTFENSLLRGTHILSIKFFGRISNNYKDFYRIPVTNDNGNTSWIIATNTLFPGICTLFPCLGDSTHKMNFNISIEHHTSEIPLSSMPNQQTESGDNDMLWTHFSTNVPMSIYEITFLLIPNIATSTFQFSAGIVLWSRNESIAKPRNINYEPLFFYVSSEVMSFYRTRFGELKIPQIHFIAIPGFQHDAVATPGFILHREEDIIFDHKFQVTSIVQRNNIWRFVARQIALQWFLKSFKPSIRRSYQWFNAVAEFFGVYALDKIFHTSKMMNWFVVHTVHDSLHLDVDNLMEPITNLQNTSPNITHLRVPPFVKVSSLLRMIENQIGQQFWIDTREYLNESLTPNNNWNCFLYDHASSALRAEIREDNKNCPYWEWIQISNYILMHVEEGSICNFKIHARFTTSDWNTKKCIGYCFGAEIFLAFLYELRQNLLYGSLDFSRAWISFNYPIAIRALRNETKECMLVLNLNHNVYCRVLYAYQNPKMFIDASSYAILPVLTRAQIIDDEYHLLVEKKKTVSMLPTIIRYLHNETEYEVWYTVIRILEAMSGFLPFSDDKDIISFKETVSVVLDKLSQNLAGIRDVDDSHSCLRYESIKWACLFNSTLCYFFDEQVKYMIQGLNDDALMSYNQSKLLSGPWQEWLHCDGLKHVANINALTKILLNSKSKNNFYYEFVKYLPCLGFNVMLQYLNDVPNIRDADRVIVFQSLVAKHINTNMKDILRSLPLIKPRTMKSTTALCIIINHTYSPTIHVLTTLLVYVTDIGISYNISLPFIPRNMVSQKIALRQSQITKHKNTFKYLWNMK